MFSRNLSNTKTGTFYIASPFELGNHSSLIWLTAAADTIMIIMIGRQKLLPERDNVTRSIASPSVVCIDLQVTPVSFSH